MRRTSTVFGTAAAACLGALLAAAGCTESQHARMGSAKAAPVAGMPGGGQPEAGGSQPADMARIDLTQPGSWVRGSAEAEIIDTRTFPEQIQAMDFVGEPTDIEALLESQMNKEGKKQLKPGRANRLVAGELTGQVRANPRANFPGIDATPWSPPDPTLAVGPNHIVETVNMDIAWYGKDGTLQFRSRLDNSGSPGFFEGVGGGAFTFDPKCFYDHESGRFFVLALEQYSSGQQSYITFAVSDDSDPNGVWYKYRTNSVVTISGQKYWVDYPGLGYDGDAFYVNGNLFGFSSGFGGVLFRSIDKSSVLSGGTAQWTDIRNGNAGSVQASQHFGSNAAPYFIEHWSNSSLMMTAIRNPLTAPQLVTREVTVPSYSGGSDAPNNGGSLDVLDGRLINAMWRNERLVTGHGVKPSGASTTQSRWYEIDTRGWPESGQNPTLVQSGNINGGSGVYTWFPALYINEAGDIGLVTAHSSSSLFASVRYTGRAAGDPAGTMGALQTGKVGNQAVSGRWGDYFDMALDPDGCTFWLVGEYYENGGWDTWIQSFTVSECCRVDLNGDGNVNTQDVLLFLNLWSAGDEVADWNGDGTVNTQDVLAFLNSYNAGC
jgi:hypothetical protein